MAVSIHLVFLLSLVLFISVSCANPINVSCSDETVFRCLKEGDIHAARIPKNHTREYLEESCGTIDDVETCLADLNCTHPAFIAAELSDIGILKYTCDNMEDYLKYRDCVDDALYIGETKTYCHNITGRTCEVYKERLSCASEYVTAECGEEANTWFTGFHTELWEPYAQLVDCELSGGSVMPMISISTLVATFLLTLMTV